VIWLRLCGWLGLCAEQKEQPNTTDHPNPTQFTHAHTPPPFCLKQERGVTDITACDLSSTMLSQLQERFPGPGSVGNDTGACFLCWGWGDQVDKAASGQGSLRLAANC